MSLCLCLTLKVNTCLKRAWSIPPWKSKHRFLFQWNQLVGRQPRLGLQTRRRRLCSLLKAAASKWEIEWMGRLQWKEQGALRMVDSDGKQGFSEWRHPHWRHDWEAQEGLSRGNCYCPREQNTAPANGRATCSSQPRKQSLWDWIQAREDQWPVAASPGPHGSQVQRTLVNRTRVQTLKAFGPPSISAKDNPVNLRVLYPTVLAHAHLINVTFINFKILLISQT